MLVDTTRYYQRDHTVKSAERRRRLITCVDVHRPNRALACKRCPCLKGCTTGDAQTDPRAAQGGGCCTWPDVRCDVSPLISWLPVLGGG